MTTGKKFLRAAEIAALTGASERTVRRWIAEGILPSARLGGARLVALEALERLLSAVPEDLPEITETSDENGS